MKNGHKAPKENLSGPKYWRSLDHMVETDEFKTWLNSEFPSAAQQVEDAPSRRHFMKIMSAGFLLAGFGMTGCRRPEELLIPFTRDPGDYTHGVPEYFATSRPTPFGAAPVLAKSADGRPVKLDSNPQHPDNVGTSPATQASVLDLYDPDRQKKVMSKGEAVSKSAGFEKLKSEAQKLASSKGEGYAFLLDGLDSPSRDRLVKKMQAKYPKAAWHQYNPLDLSSFINNSENGLKYLPCYKLDKAKRIISIGSDFLGNDSHSERHSRDFAKGRRIASATEDMSRLYVVEGHLSLTGSNADHRLRLSPSQIERFVYELAFELITQKAYDESLISDSGPILQELRRLSGDQNKFGDWVKQCASDIKSTGHSVIIPGDHQPASVHYVCQILNQILGNVGDTVEYKPREDKSFTPINLLANALNSGSISTLIMVGGNPVYDAPTDLNWKETQKKASVIRLNTSSDASNQGVDWSFPRSHFLESWGDGRTADGTLVSIQPLIAPLFDSLTDIEFLAHLAGETETNPHKIVQETFRGISRASDFEASWRHFLHNGFLADSYYRYAKPNFSLGGLLDQLKAYDTRKAPKSDSLDVIYLADCKIGDGTMSNNGWLQELPDPITKITWDNVILMSAATAKSLGLPDSNRVGNKYNLAKFATIKLGDKSISGPVWIQSGFAENTIGLTMGYGKKEFAGRIESGVGEYNASDLRFYDAPFIAQGATVSANPRTEEIACTQDHGSMEGRPIIREANLDQFRKHPDFANSSMGVASHFPHELPAKIYNHPYENYEEKRKAQEEKDGTTPRPIIKSTVHQWAMTIDLNTCTGCNACVMSCQAENNIPIVGKDQVRRGREMHWIRIDRYFSAPVTKSESGNVTRRKDEELPADPQVSVQPMACVQCENAPCETVCPVNATVHDEEGLNLMVYNRCVGTRYCSNNCPYKVRRFNFFDYNLRPLKDLYDSPLTLDKLPRRPKDEFELMKLVRNPDVTVRMRGVMEKCTYCAQRIASAKIAQKIKAGASDDVQVPDGSFSTACQDACSSNAIVFGNKLDPESAVSKTIKNPRNYTVLGYLETLPRTTHLAKVRNPNPLMPDAPEIPYTTQEYFRKAEGDPFEGHHGHHDDHADGDSHNDHGSKDNHGKETAH